MPGRRLLGRCPVCGEPLDVVRLHCRSCDTAVEGRFDIGRFAALGPEQLDFLETFLRARGNIREVERELGLSYPTVRSRLDALLAALGLAATGADEEQAPGRRAVLDALERGEITADEAVRRLRG
ncbi:MAG TPA: DUF2089 domain-containing protein [Bacillota bacterium]|nr:DUF2089 domain-containing protein [Bacillota bacterium]